MWLSFNVGQKKMHAVSESRLGIADATADLREVIKICSEAGMKVLPEDGGGAAAYAFSIRASDWSGVLAAAISTGSMPACSID